MSDSHLRNQFAQLMFYVRERYWNHGEKLCASVATSFDDWTFRVWRALCLDQQGLFNEAMKEYRNAEAKRQTTIPALMGMLLVYKRSKDNENVTRIELKLQDAETTATDAAVADGLTQAAALAWAAGDVHTARDVMARIPESQMDSHVSEYTNAATIKGWIELSAGRGALVEKCGTYFQKVMDMMQSHGSGLDINAALGRVAYLERKYQFSPAQDLLNKLVVAYPHFLPILVVKARLLMRAEDWDQAIDTAHRILAKDKGNMEALSLQALHALVKDARPAAAQQYLTALWDAAKEKEPRNAPLMFQFAQVFSRLASGTGGSMVAGESGTASSGASGASLQLLAITAKFSGLAVSLDSRNGDYLSEVGYEALYKGEYKLAVTTFQKAAGLTDSLSPILGTVACLIKQGKLEEAAKQCALCNELQADASRVAELQLLNAKIAWRLRHDEKRSLLLLDQAAEAVRQDIQGVAGANGLDLHRRVHVPLMLEIAREYCQHCRNEPPDPTFRHADPIGEKLQKHLELLRRHVPGCMEAQVMLARTHFISGDIAAAQSILKDALLQREQPLPEGFLLSAQICQYMGNTKLAAQSLEQALTLDFEIKDQPLYNVLHGVLLAASGTSSTQTQKALEAFNLAMSIAKNPSRVTNKGTAIEPLSVPDHITLYLQLAQIHLRLHDADEARKLLAECAAMFHDTQQAGRVLIAQSMLTARTDIDQSIEQLRQVPASSAFYVSARTQMAKMYLVHKLDPVKYIQCFEEMVAERATPQSYVELGEAFTTIQEPEKAIAAFEKAKAMDPQNSELAVKVGRALVSTHDYKKSVKYYEDAIAADANLFSVRADLAMLYAHLGDPNMALQTLKEAPVYTREPSSTEDVVTAVERVNCALLMYKVSRGSGRDGEAVEALLQAKKFQAHLLESKLASETRETMLQQKTIMATILTELGRYYAADESTSTSASTSASTASTAAALVNHETDLAKAKQYLNEALQFNDAFEPAMLALARLHLAEDAALSAASRRAGEEATGGAATTTATNAPSAAAEQCEQRCNAVLRINPNCEEAVVILTRLMMRQRVDRSDEARQLFQELLENNPQNYEALLQYIQLLRNAGDMDAVESVVDNAVSKAPANQRPDPGLSYVRGMAAHYANANADALRAFNLARLPSDNPWSTRALIRMIHIYLVPTTVDMWADNWVVEEKTGNLKCAEQLLLQLPMGEERQVLHGFCLLSTKKKEETAKAMQVFLSAIKAVQPQTEAERQALLQAERERKAAEEAAKKAAMANNEIDEDDLLLDEMENAPVPGAGDDNGVVGTLAEALACKVVHIPALLGLAISLYLSGQVTAARNALLHVFATATPHQQQQVWPDETERAKLFMAFLCVETNQLGNAQRYLEEVLQENQSCSSAWDSLGMLHERKQQHAEASQCFQKAWKLVKESDPNIGYKLAFNYLKGSDPVRAIDVSRTVLRHHATFPRIEEDVMDVAFSMLRT